MTPATNPQSIERPTAWEFARLECGECGETFLQTIELLNHQDKACPVLRQARSEQRRISGRRGRR